MSAKEKVLQITQQIEAPRRVPLSRAPVLRAAVALADEAGIESLSMRKHPEWVVSRTVQVLNSFCLQS